MVQGKELTEQMTKKKYFATGAFPYVGNVGSSSGTVTSEIGIRYRLNLFVNNFMVSLIIDNDLE